MKLLAVHIAELPAWITMAFATDEMDFAKNSYDPVTVSNTNDIGEHFEKSLISRKNFLQAAKE